MNWMLMPVRRYAEFSGRSRRLEFWMFSLMNFIVAIVLAGPAYMAFVSQMSQAVLTAQGDPAREFDILTSLQLGTVPMIMLVLYVLYALFMLIPSIAVVVRRLHDRNLSGWWYLGLILVSWIPLVGLVASVAFIVFMFLDGTPGPNRFGPDPKGRTNEEVFS